MYTTLPISVGAALLSCGAAALTWWRASRPAPEPPKLDLSELRALVVEVTELKKDVLAAKDEANRALGAARQSAGVAANHANHAASAQQAVQVLHDTIARSAVLFSAPTSPTSAPVQLSDSEFLAQLAGEPAEPAPPAPGQAGDPWARGRREIAERAQSPEVLARIEAARKARDVSSPLIAPAHEAQGKTHSAWRDKAGKKS
jgi:hypothetical protein